MITVSFFLMKMHFSSDMIYAEPLEKVSDFVFDQKVANVFEDMIQRSVPGYNAIVEMIGCLGQQYVTEGSICYDLGCSLGTATLALRRRLEESNIRIVAVDHSPAMVEECRRNIARDVSRVPVEVVCKDILDVSIEKASLVILNFTLQFIDPQKRVELLYRIFQGMLPGGILVISDKIAFRNASEQEFQENMHQIFKKLNGYSELEIAQKRTALEKVLIPDTLEQHQERLTSIGFKSLHVWFQCFNFVSIISFK